jgi:hypothetical protein
LKTLVSNQLKKYKMKKTISLICCLAVFSATAQNNKTAALRINNPSNQGLNQSVVSLAWAKVLKVYPTLATADFKVLNAANNKEVPFQLEYLGNSTIQNLLVQVDVPAHSKVLLNFVKGKPSPVMAKTYGRFVPERKDDFAWENDKIAFRMYGKELEKTPAEMAYGMDVWAKRTTKLIINERYKRGEYHVDHGDGLDYYHVGLTLGAGNMMPYVNDSVYYSKNYVSYKVLDNGPLRTTFQLIYNNWQVANQSLSAVKTISLDAGSQLNKITVQYLGRVESNLQVAAGLVTRKEAGVKYLNEQNGVMAYWEPTHGEDGTTGVACVFVNQPIKIKDTKTQLLAIAQTDNQNTITYYAGATWDKAGEITNAKKWFDYTNDFIELEKNKALIKIE